MSVENFLTRMNALVDELRAHPKVTLLNYHVPPPATEEDFAAVEAHIGRPLPKDIKAFYRQCNGIQLRWVHKDNKDVDHKLWSGFIEGPFEYEEILIEQGFEGVVNILDVKSVFFRELPFARTPLKPFEYPEPYTYFGKEVEFEELRICLWNFDILHSNYDFAVFLGHAEENYCYCALMEFAHRTPAENVPLLTFEQYLQWIIIKKGCADARIFHLLPSQRGYNMILAGVDSLLEVANPAPYDLNYSYHR